jgi:glycosyltransferase involved in cell wall biosynthesis
MTSAKGWRGSGASYAKLARGLSERGHLTRLITGGPGLTARLLQEGIPVTEIVTTDTGPREAWELLRELRRLGAHAIVVDTPRDLRLSVWATLLHRAKIVYRYNLNYRRPPGDLADRLYTGRVAGWVFQSDFIQEDALRHYPWIPPGGRFQVPNGYDTGRFFPQPEAGLAFRRQWNIPENAIVVLTAAKLAKNKGHSLALEALRRLRSRGLNLVYVICGNGPRESELRGLASAHDIPARFTGLLSTEDLIAALAAADLVLHPSVLEIFPNAVGEAMACARAVVAVDAGGTSELLGRDGSTGILVPPDDPEAMAKAVQDLVLDPEHRTKIGSAARCRIETEFPLNRMIDGYESALYQVIGRNE